MAEVLVSGGHWFARAGPPTRWNRDRVGPSLTGDGWMVGKRPTSTSIGAVDEFSWTGCPSRSGSNGPYDVAFAT